MMNFKKNVVKNETYDIKLKTKFYTLFRQYIVWSLLLRLRRKFFKCNFNIIFFQISNLSFYLNLRTSLGKLLGISLGKRYDAWYLLFGTCPCTSHMPKFWHTYMIMYSDFIVIVKPCPNPQKCQILLDGMNSIIVCNDYQIIRQMTESK